MHQRAATQGRDRVQAHPDLHSVAVDAGVVVVRGGRHGAHVLDAVSAAVLDILAEPQTTDELVTTVAGLTGAGAAAISPDLRRLVDDLERAGLLDDGQDRPVPSPVWPLPRTSCQNTFDAWHTWAPVTPVRAGAFVLGLRTDDDDVAAALPGLVGADPAPAGADVPAHLSLETRPRSVGPAGSRPLARLSWGCETVATATHWEQLVDQMRGWVETVTMLACERVGLVGSAVVVDGGCLVLPVGFSGVTARRRLARLGRVLPGPAVVLDLDPLEVVTPTERHRVVAWAVTAPATAAEVVAGAYARLVPLPADPGGVLAALAALATGGLTVVVDPKADPRSWSLHTRQPNTETFSPTMRRDRAGERS